jgi:hypothetical protein
MNCRMMNWKMRMMVTSSRLRSSKVITIRPSLLLMKELEFSTKRKTQLRTNGQRHELSHDEMEGENDGYIIKITVINRTHNSRTHAPKSMIPK